MLILAPALSDDVGVAVMVLVPLLDVVMVLDRLRVALSDPVTLCVSDVVPLGLAVDVILSIPVELAVLV